jgi:phosphatidylserine/phosphatidylglycerophosphate/cardiolipin synthase-like enzyme
VRRFDLRASTGGILHAKYFLVDGREAYLGSQNFDWRSLGHIQEIGLRIRQEDLVRSLEEVFELDWARAGGHGAAAAPTRRPRPSYPLRVDYQSEAMSVTPALSPTGMLPDESLWDLPQLVRRLDQARESIHLQLLTYEPTMRDGSPFSDLDEALRRAASRGVAVQLLLADWCTRAGTVEPLQRLAELPHVEIRLATIPRWSGGFIPFARVIHAKYLVVDGAVAWVGTSNWSGDYFLKSRNVGLVIEGSGFAARLERVFRSGWDGPYVERLDPTRRYDPPRVEHE